MSTTLRSTLRIALCVLAATAAMPALADPPDRGGGHREQRGHGDDDGDRGGHRDEDRDHRGDERWFEDRHRSTVNDYYTERYRGKKHCPPGLARRDNGCVPPGHERRWRIGEPLPRDVVYHNLPEPLVVELGPPPPHHKFVRVASDILLIAIGTGMVVDAIEDLGR